MTLEAQYLPFISCWPKQGIHPSQSVGRYILPTGRGTVNENKNNKNLSIGKHQNLGNFKTIGWRSRHKSQHNL